MPNYNILRAKKVKTRSQITQAAEHNFRLRHQRNIDKNRTHLNRTLVNTLNIDTNNASSLQEGVTAYYKNLGVKEKEGNVLMMEFVISASPDFFKNKSKKQIDEWASHQVGFMRKEFGEQLKIAILHMDEKTPHFHFMVSTEVKSFKKYKNQKGEFHKETWSLNAKRYDPNFLRGLHDRHAEWNKNFGLVRGVRGSLRKHHDPKEFYKMIDEALSTKFDKTIEKTISDMETGWFSGKASIAEIREKFKPMMNTLLKSNEVLRKKFLFDIKQWAENLYKQKKEQEAKKLELEKQEKDLTARRELYAEALNSKNNDVSLLSSLMDRNEVLQQEIERLKAKNEVLDAQATPMPTSGSTNSLKSPKTLKK
ncbi:MobV family relaxase [Burkholderia vietnamiensis]|uniref:MobV family relaxase n=1 Tax=Burkholderia vietnamiensis TaxID=60552 RepID=UPI001CF4CAA8|nr:MobV family relaxase [Burkholderia vietnamiensis]MCA8068302.1 plasmid recombination protein [Burkholderia vietnamiensis]